MADSKLTSRKFMVWITWLVISILIAIVMAATLIVTKNVPDSLVSLFVKIIEYFFIISLVYLGVNLGQKGIEVLKEKVEVQEESTEENSDAGSNTEKDFNAQ